MVTAQEMLRYAMILPVATTICGIDSPAVLKQVVDVASSFRPMSYPEMDALRARCADKAADGRYELYKVSLRYDNPVARQEHGFPDDPLQKEIALLDDEVMNPSGSSR